MLCVVCRRYSYIRPLFVISVMCRSQHLDIDVVFARCVLFADVTRIFVHCLSSQSCVDPNTREHDYFIATFLNTVSRKAKTIDIEMIFTR